MTEPPIFLIARVLAFHDTLTDSNTRALMKDVAERLSSASFQLDADAHSPSEASAATSVADEPKSIDWQSRATALEARELVLVEALKEILCCHDGNQAPELNMPDLDYARRTISAMHRIARAALSAQDPANG